MATVANRFQFQTVFSDVICYTGTLDLGNAATGSGTFASSDVTVTGAALKQMVTLFGDGFSKAFGAAAPVGVPHSRARNRAVAAVLRGVRQPSVQPLPFSAIPADGDAGFCVGVNVGNAGRQRRLLRRLLLCGLRLRRRQLLRLLRKPGQHAAHWGLLRHLLRLGSSLRRWCLLGGKQLRRHVFDLTARHLDRDVIALGNDFHKLSERCHCDADFVEL